MPIHVQRPDGKVLTWAEKQDIKMLEMWRLSSEIIYVETHDALMNHIKRPSFQTTITTDWRDNIDPFEETERGEE